MTDCTIAEAKIQGELFAPVKRRRIKVDFDGGDVSSDGGLLLLRQIDRKLGIISRMADILGVYDKREKAKITHSVRSMLVQRVYGISCGYEDLNDHDALRKDILWQAAADRVDDLSSSSTLCRLEQTSEREMCFRLMDLMTEVFIESFSGTPEELVLDFDNTDDPVHGRQEGRFFHGYYDKYCFLPLYVYCGQKLVTVLLQPSDRDGSKMAGAVLKKLVGKMRAAWPGVKIIYRGDSGFARKRHMHWMERNGVDYVIGLAKNSRLKAELSETMALAEEEYLRTGEKTRVYHEFKYAALSWHGRKRRVIGKAEYGRLGSNPRFVVTSLEDDPQYIYEKRYCPRGDMENRLKEQQLGLFSDRTSAHGWWSNQLRILLSGFAYVLFERMRNTALAGTDLAKAQAGTIRLKLLKIGAVISRNTRTIRISLASSFPYRNLFRQVAEHFAPG